MKIRARSEKVLLCAALAFLLLGGLCGCGRGGLRVAIGTGDRGLYHYSYKRIWKFLRRAGHSEFINVSGRLTVRRNCDGSELRIVYADINNALILSKDGSVTKIDVPSERVWLNSDHEPVRWVKCPPGHGATDYFMDGTHDEDRSISAWVSECREYILRTTWPYNHDRDVTYVASADDPLNPLITVSGHYTSMYVRGEEAFCFGGVAVSRVRPDIPPEKTPRFIEMQKLRVKDGSLEDLGKRVIDVGKDPTPGNWKELDMSPWSPHLLLHNPVYWPWQRIYLFNLRTKELKYLGSNGWRMKRNSFFLQDDILANCEEALARKDR